MRWQRYARVVVALVGIGVRRRAVRLLPEATGARAAAARGRRRPGSHRAERRRPHSSATRATRKSARSTTRARKRTPTAACVFEKPHIVSAGDRGFEAVADKSESKGKSVNADNPEAMEFTGHVRVHMKDGLELADRLSAIYNDVTGGVTIPGPLSFTRGRMSGAESARRTTAARTC